MNLEHPCQHCDLSYEEILRQHVLLMHHKKLNIEPKEPEFEHYEQDPDIEALEPLVKSELEDPLIDPQDDYEQDDQSQMYEEDPEEYDYDLDEQEQNYHSNLEEGEQKLPLPANLLDPNPAAENPITIEAFDNKTKKQFCYYCQKWLTQIFRHLRSHHHREEDVQRAIELQNSGMKKEAELLLGLVVRKGNHLHNMNVIRNNHGVLVVARRPNADENTNINDFAPCDYCYSWIFKIGMRRHKKFICKYRPENPETPPPEIKRNRKKFTHEETSLIFGYFEDYINTEIEPKKDEIQLFLKSNGLEFNHTWVDIKYKIRSKIKQQRHKRQKMYQNQVEQNSIQSQATSYSMQTTSSAAPPIL